MLLPNQPLTSLQTIRPYSRPVTADEGTYLPHLHLPAKIFDQFRARCAPELAAQNSSEFWLRLVLQACHSEEPVWHAAAAFGVLHRVYKDNGVRAVMNVAESPKQRLAYRQYHQAVTSLRSTLERRDSYSMQVALITCVLLVCFDLMSNRYRAALTHLKSGLWILNECRRGEDEVGGGDDLTSLAQKLGRFTIDQTVHEPFHLLHIQAIFFGIVRLRNPVWPEPSILAAKPIPPEGFQSVDEARQSLEHIIECIASYVMEAHQNSSSSTYHLDTENLRGEQQHLKLRLEKWYASAKRLMDSRSFAVASVHVQFYAEWILLSTALSKGAEVAFDDYMPEFERIVELVEECASNCSLPTFSVQHGVIAALYYTALKCRDPKIRRRAIKLLASPARREGMWESSVAALKGTWIMEKEETGLSIVETARDVPESVRIHQSMIMPSKGEKPIVVYRRQRFEWADGSWVLFDGSTGTEYQPRPGEFEVNAAQWKLYVISTTCD